MKKIFALVLFAVMTVTACAALSEGDGGPGIAGTIVDGAYVLSVTTDPEDAGEWRADEMAQDDSVVKLAAAGTENGVFTARYEPTGDGSVSVNLRHFNAHHVCDEMHSFDLSVRDGKVQEVTGGSYTASPAEEEMDLFFSGEWLEKDSRFTVLDVTKKIEDGWDVEIMSPVSHGAWLIRATAYYDCDYDAFVYSDGVKYDLLPEDKAPAKETASGLWGTLKLTGTEENIQIEWYDQEMAESIGSVTFERAPALPPYHYTGDDPLEGAVAEKLAADERAAQFKTEPGYVTIPCVNIFRTEMTDETHAKVYGTFWILNYVKRGLLLINISGGEFPGIMTLEKDGEQWKVTETEDAGDGDDYAEDIRRFANGDEKLEDMYFAASDLLSEEQAKIRTRFIRDYVKDANLGITAYQDFGWDPVALETP